MSDPAAIRRMSVADFRREGFLQELNRQFMHPLGLALEVVVDHETGGERFGLVWDYREDAEGMSFGDGELDAASAARGVEIAALRARKAEARRRLLGYEVQPLPGVVT